MVKKRLDGKWNTNNLLATVQCMETLTPQDLGYITTYGDSISKSFRDIFIGIDVWGRGAQLYTAGFGCYKAFPFINSANAGLSSALYAPGWTWESTDALSHGQTWHQWFDYDKMLWVGPNDANTVPGHDDAYMPISKFFLRNPPPNPTTLAFHTTFCPGIGLGWFVNGAQVLHTTQDGWTDVQKQTSLGDMLWPTPMVQWSQDKTQGNSESIPKPDVFVMLNMVDKVWSGGSCVALGFFAKTGHIKGNFPIQSFAFTPGQAYDVSLIYNIDSRYGTLVLDLTINRLSTSITQISVADTKDDPLTLGWHKLATTFSVTSDHPDDVLASIGLKLMYDSNDSGNNFDFSILLGQMNVIPVLPPALDGTTTKSSVLWADFETTTPGSATVLPSGILTWDVTTFFDQSNVTTDDTTTDNTKPPWTLQNPESWLPKFLYFNIYAQAYSKDGSIGGPDKAGFVGTTGLDGRANRFFVDSNIWPDGILGASKAMLYVQGVTDHGDVLPWDRCASVTIDL
jgi:mannosyl-glycoprotein endo-beta-N-acetylglucosaminidase